MADSTPTRPLATVRAATPARLRAWAVSLRAEPLLVLALVGIGLAAQGLNGLDYPATTFTDDEGVYAQQAWAVLREGRLAPYTYTYDHPPGGWLLLAGWMALTGGPFAFGGAIDSGRVLMLLLHGAMVPLLYGLARRLGCGLPAAALGAFFFSTSPLAIFYQRLLLLDTIMLFWALLSLVLLLDGRGRRGQVVLSGVCFALALLSKETAAILTPALLLIAWQERRRHEGRYGAGAWLLPVLLLAGSYPLYAALRGELLPTGSGLSLVETLRWQASRGGGGPFNVNNQFWQLVRGDWLPRDRTLLIGGVAATALNLLRGAGLQGARNRHALVAGLLGALPLLFLARGGLVLSFYILFAIPFLCLNLAVLLAPIFARLPRVGGAFAAIAALGLIGGYLAAGTLGPLYREHPAEASRQAVAWIKENISPDSFIVTRDSLWTDLHEPGLGGPAFPNAHGHWKVARDPAIRQGVFKDDWHTVDYLVISPSLRGDFEAANNSVVLEALRHARLVERWAADGAEIELWQVDKPNATERALLSAGASSIARRFERDGASVAPDGTVTSQAQAYAMLRAVWSGDRAAFGRAWDWTTANLRNADGLLSWRWRDGRVVDTGTATDADSDVALALLLAGQRWNDPALREAGTAMVRAIWAREVVTVGGKPYIAAGDWATQGPIIALNPSHFAPYAYPIFKEVDREHDWYGVIDSGYQVLFDASSAPLGAPRAAGLPPDWLGLDRASGALVPFRFPPPANETTRYGPDAARTYWRIALHRRWNGDGRAETYLRGAGFLRGEVGRKGYVSAVYARDGTILTEEPSPIGHAGALAALLTLDPPAANALHERWFVGEAGRDGSGVHWGDPNDVDAQGWAWFAIALYADALPNLWTDPAAR